MKGTNFFFVLLFLISCVEQESPKLERGDTSSKVFFHINEMIDYRPEMVAPGIISTGDFEGHATVTPDGKAIYFAIYNNDHTYSTIAYSSKNGSKWSKPQIGGFSGKYSDGSPVLSPDGTTLLFSSNRPTSGTAPKSDIDIWYVERSSNG